MLCCGWASPATGFCVVAGTAPERELCCRQRFGPETCTTTHVLVLYMLLGSSRIVKCILSCDVARVDVGTQVEGLERYTLN